MGNNEDFGRFYAGLALDLNEIHRVKSVSEDLKELPAIWPRAIESLTLELSVVSKRLLSRLSEMEVSLLQAGRIYEITNPRSQRMVQLIQQIDLFPSTIAYTIHEKAGTVVLSSSDKPLERALEFGTRDLPVIKPLTRLARFLTKALGTNSVVFIDENFPHEANPNSKSKTRGYHL
jgi:hypothetical protein